MCLNLCFPRSLLVEEFNKHATKNSSLEPLILEKYDANSLCKIRSLNVGVSFIFCLNRNQPTTRLLLSRRNLDNCSVLILPIELCKRSGNGHVTIAWISKSVKALLQAFQILHIFARYCNSKHLLLYLFSVSTWLSASVYVFPTNSRVSPSKKPI